MFKFITVVYFLVKILLYSGCIKFNKLNLIKRNSCLNQGLPNRGNFSKFGEGGQISKLGGDFKTLKLILDILEL